MSDLPHWARHLRHANPDKPLIASNPQTEGQAQDELTWGQQKVLSFDASAGTGPFQLTANQIIEATRPARVWSLTLAVAALGISDPTLIHAPNSTITATFIVQLGVGQVLVKRYQQLFDTDMVAFIPDINFPLKTDVPIASITLPNLPARKIVVSCQVVYQRILLAGPSKIDILVSTEVAPVFR